ncbi:MAG: DUF4389 domain-containing protein, partial [Actinomycetota bacterium]
KAWLLALPHLLIVGLLTGGSYSVTTDESAMQLTFPGLIGVLAVIAGLALLFTGRYPETLFNLLMGLNRWVYRVMGYVLLMTDDYPPFRLDMGGTEEAVPAAGPIAPLPG